jgi:hypothetical protein
MIALRDRGAVSDIRAGFDWVRDNRGLFEAALG